MATTAISSAGSSAVARSRQSGFTLLELLVVLVIAALLMAVVPPMLHRALPGVELKATARQLAAGLRFARNQAIATRSPARLIMDMESRQFSVSGRSRIYRVPEEIDIELFTAEVETESETRGGIRFFPSGGSTGGRITLTHGERKFEVDVDWLTGKVRIMEPGVGG